MRSRFVPALLSIALLALVGRVVGAQGRGQDARPGIAVLPFDNSGSYGQDKENFDACRRASPDADLGARRQPGAAWSSATPSRSCSPNRTSVRRQGDPGNRCEGREARRCALRHHRAFIDFYGDFRLDARLVNVETSEIVKVESDRMQRTTCSTSSAPSPHA